MRQKHADLIHAWAEGAEIEIYDPCVGQWNECSYPSFFNKRKYRIKPTLKPDVVWYANPRIDGDICTYMSTIPVAGSNLKLTFDGDTGELKYAEVIK